jgi:hypothetical protein
MHLGRTFLEIQRTLGRLPCPGIGLLGRKRLKNQEGDPGVGGLKP